MKSELYRIAKNLGLSENEVKTFLSSSTIDRKFDGNTDVYKAGTRYGTVGSEDIYKSGGYYGTTSIKDF